MVRTSILVIDDEPGALELIRFNLSVSGFRVMTANTAARGINKARSLLPNLIVLDLMLPDLDGFELCKVLRGDSRTAHIPIVIVSARTGEVDRVLGLELGAADYIIKPFSPRELLLRVRRVLEKSSQESDTKAQCFRLGDLFVDKASHEVRVRGKPVTLTPTEFKLLTLFLERRDRVQSRDQLLRDVADVDADIHSRTIDTHMRRLRAKLGSAARHLATVRGFGYRFVG
jgi:two-component system phosphate regulon response regulator PhoB